MTELRRIAEVVIRGAAVPWSTPESFLGGRPGGPRHHVHKKNKHLIAWQDAIRAAVDLAVPGRSPYAGPVMLTMTFLKAAPGPAMVGRRWWSRAAVRGSGDLTNYAKAAEDAIKSWDQYRGRGPERRLILSWPGLIADDAQVCDSFLRKRYGAADGAEIRVYAIEEDEGASL